MAKLTTRILFSKYNVNTESEFCEIYTLDKQHKVYSKELFINTANELEIRLHADLFSRRNTLLGIGSYRYGAILIDETTRIRFSIIINLKNTIYDKSKILFKKIKTFMGRKIQYFWSDNTGKYQLLIPYFKKKSIIWEKSASYA